MNTKNLSLGPILLAALLLSLASATQADDTEIYTGGNLVSTVKPNIVFIIDTSGSMNTDVTMTSGTYDPATTYAGDCNVNRIYWSSSGKPPDCDTSHYIAKTSFVCAAATSGLDNSGYYTGRAARYNVKSGTDEWENLSQYDHTELVECQADWGVHGKSDASTNLYPADSDADNNSDPGYRSNTSGAISWSGTGSTYTFYSANYLNWRESPGTIVTKTRLKIVQEVFSELMDSISDINIAVARFDRDANGGYFVMPMQVLSDANRTDYKTSVNNMTASGNTPLAETLYETYLFYRGDPVRYGDESEPGTNHTGVLDPDNTSDYLSPVAYQCQSNFVILLTDGEPTSDTGADSYIKGLPGFSTATGSSKCSGNCLDELAEYMYKKDCSTLYDTQNVITYTIGFHTDQTLLSNAATKGGGKYYTADDTAGLTDAFTAILTDILAINTTFIAPAVSVNAFNRFTHRDELYYALFKPNKRPTWDGNIKRFKLDGDPPIIVDANGDPAVDANTGFFKSSATSFWTASADAPDGDSVEMGGAASRLALPRSVYTYTGATAANNEDLTANSNQLHEDNGDITKEMLGDAGMSDTTYDTLLQWARGVDLQDDDSDEASDDARTHMGDPLHAKPLLITYGGTDDAPDMTLYAATNEGYLHAIDTDDGSEVFSFMPQELLPNLSTMYTNASADSHPYGLDGPLTSWVYDANGNGLLYDSSNVLETGEFVYLYQGMRRGGSNYYSLDVTNRAVPLLKWVIKGGAGDFSELAQTWSAATHAKIKLNGTDKQVLIFGGGYDVDQDGNSTAADDDTGRAIFIVDAATGAKIWQAGPAGTANGSDPDLVLNTMTNSIPSDIRVIDVNSDGYSDRMYVGDMRGQIWRFDIDNEGNTGASDLATGGIIASIGGNTTDSNRRFYYAPDVSLSKKGDYINIAIGSGYRAHPLDEVIHDAFFVIRDPNIYAAATDVDGNAVYTTVTLGDLYDATANLIGEGTAEEVLTATTTLGNSGGWYIWLRETDGNFIGEKVLAKSITYEAKVMFTTFTPVASATGACAPNQGTARTYLVSIEDATPVIDFNLSGGSLTAADRAMTLVRGGIPPEPTVLFNEDGIVTLIGTEKGPDPDIDLAPRKLYWKQD